VSASCRQARHVTIGSLSMPPTTADKRHTHCVRCLRFDCAKAPNSPVRMHSKPRFIHHITLEGEASALTMRPFVAPGVQGTYTGGPKTVFRAQCLEGKEKKHVPLPPPRHRRMAESALTLLACIGSSTEKIHCVFVHFAGLLLRESVGDV
jgi:hypothetical protein